MRTERPSCSLLSHETEPGPVSHETEPGPRTQTGSGVWERVSDWSDLEAISETFVPEMNEWVSA